MIWAYVVSRKDTDGMTKPVAAFHTPQGAENYIERRVGMVIGEVRKNFRIDAVEVRS